MVPEGKVSSRCISTHQALEGCQEIHLNLHMGQGGAGWGWESRTDTHCEGVLGHGW